MAYLDPEVVSDEVTVAEAILTRIADQIPGWEPSEGHVETAVAEAMAMVAATIAALLKDEARDVYTGFAANILGIARRPEGVASASSDWSMTDDAGYLIPDGTHVYMRRPDGEMVAFASVGDVTVPAGQTSAAGVPLVALEAGPQANGLVGAAEAFDQVVGVASVTLTTVASGGADAETIEAFAERAADRARRLRAIPITVDDFAAMTLDHEAVARAMAVNLLDPAAPPAPGDDPASGGHVTVFPVDVAGLPLSPADAAEVAAMLTGPERPLNVIVHVEEPTYTTVDVAITFRLEPGVDGPAMEAAVAAAISDYLSPATWALDEAAPGRWRPPDDAARVIRHFDIAHVADSLAGVAGVVTCTVNGGTSVTMTGWAPLPSPGTIVATAA
ncbi:baseplate J/gp47 family protein [Miltoncostaea marina]|uniref:baseplate J/gp47 family protein n=1 Tax=Miltoncostaea marina TaxID=2843215 RepID=UPI001C3DF992|nr:baseplate J/gp47 family protein [Miltoncostaea marina]